MMRLIFAAFTLLFFTGFGGQPIAMMGIKINDAKTVLQNIKLKVVSSAEGMTKYSTANGNDFSLTVKNNKVVYMENDWRQNLSGETPLFSDFKFGKTSLKDIRKAFGTNGFTYERRGAYTTKTDLIEFNCFEFDSTNNEVLVIITKVPLSGQITEQNVGESLKLDAIIIAGEKYLDQIWGKAKTFDPNYKKIKI